MRIEMKLGQLVDATDALKNIFAMKLPIKTSVRLARIGRELDKEFAIYEEQRRKIIGALGKEDNGITMVLPENNLKFSVQHGELLNTDISFDIDPIKISDLGDFIQVSPGDLMSCSSFILDEEDEVKKEIQIEMPPAMGPIGPK